MSQTQRSKLWSGRADEQKRHSTGQPWQVMAGRHLHWQLRHSTLQRKGRKYKFLYLLFSPCHWVMWYIPAPFLFWINLSRLNRIGCFNIDVQVQSRVFGAHEKCIFCLIISMHMQFVVPYNLIHRPCLNEGFWAGTLKILSFMLSPPKLHNPLCVIILTCTCSI